MKRVMVFSLIMLTGCVPGIFENQNTPLAKIEVDKDSLQKDTDVKISVEVLNKDVK